MHYLLQPPPLLAMLLVVGLVALVFRRTIAALLRPGAADAMARGAPAEDSEVWGEPDPQPVARVPYDYARLEMVAPPASAIAPAAPAALTVDGTAAPEHAPTGEAAPEPTLEPTPGPAPELVTNAAPESATSVAPATSAVLPPSGGIATAGASLAEILSRRQRRQEAGD